MASSTDRYEATSAQVTDSHLTVELRDGRTLSVPLRKFPSLFQASISEREKFELIGRGEGIHWPDLDEDLSVAGLFAAH